jgi:hypothetical protein
MWRSIASSWNRFWFTPSDPATLGAIRICTGLCLLYVYLSCLPDLLSFIGPHSWIDPTALQKLSELPQGGGHRWCWSIYYWIQAPVAVWMVQALFLGSIVGFTLGWQTRIMSVVVWAGHLCFIHRAFLTWSGMDTVLAMLTFYLMLTPAGAALSLDALRRRGSGITRLSWEANVGVRLIQIHTSIIYLCAGLAKLQGARWWDGTAVWSVMMMQEFAPYDMSWLGHLGDVPCMVISNVGVLLTLVMEVSFCFLIWNAKVRPILLLMALMMHAGIGMFMGMGAFGAAMLTGCLAFVEPSSVRRWMAFCLARGRRFVPAARAETPAKQRKMAA